MDEPVTFIPGGGVPGCFEEVGASISLSGLDLNFKNINLEIYKTCIINVAYPSNNLLNFTIDEVPYTFKLKKDTPDVIVVSRESLGEDIKVYVSW